MAKRAWVPWALGGLALGGVVLGVRALTKKPSPGSDGGTGPASEPLKLAKTGDKVVLVGDSIGQGLAKPLAAMLKQLGVTLVSADGKTPLVVKGVTVKGLLPVIKAHASVLYGAHTVLVSLGSNDAAMQSPNVEVQAAEDLVKLLGSTGAQVVWIVPPSFRLKPDDVPLPATEKKQNQFDMILTNGLVDNRIEPNDPVFHELSSDSIHLTTPKGYTLFAAQISSELTGATGA
jgi:hypothetical protein